MNRNDLRIVGPGNPNSALEVTSSGDVALVNGNASVRQRALLAAVTTPGALMHRPNFGAGVERYLGRPVTVAAAGFAAAWRAAILADDRVRRCRVTAAPMVRRDNGFVVTAVAETNMNEPVTFSYEV